MGRMEIITGRERRRRWSDEDKLRILEEASAPQTSAAAVARRHDLLPQQIYTWRRQFRVIEQVGDESVSFLPVGLIEEEDIARRRKARGRRSDRIEVKLVNGRALCVDADIDNGILSRLIRVVEEA